MKETTRTLAFIAISCIASYWTFKISLMELYRKATTEAHVDMLRWVKIPESDIISIYFEGMLLAYLGGMLLCGFLMYVLLVALFRFLFRKKICSSGMFENQEAILYSEPLIIPLVVFLIIGFILCNINSEYAYWILQ